MKPSVYHVGLTPPPSIEIDGFQIHYFPVLDVIFKSSHMPEDIREVLKQRPIIVLMSKNSVFGLETWLKRHSLDSDYFNNEFWTVGERTQAHLRDVFKIEANCPSLMTGKGLIAALNANALNANALNANAPSIMRAKRTAIFKSLHIIEIIMVAMSAGTN